MTRPSLIETASLTERLQALSVAAADKADLARAALHVLDWLGCALAGRATATGRRLTAVLAPDGNPFAMTGPAAAMAMAPLGSLLEMDDVHRRALLHPGPVVIPAVLAAAGGASGPDALRAIVAGYEAMIRLGSAVGPGHYAFFHNTGTCGGIGAALGAATVMSRPAPDAVSAMGHAMSSAGGLWQARNEAVMTKHLHVAEAARRGVQAAQLAAGGFAGPRFILEGPQGFFAALARDGDPGAVLGPSTGPRIAEVSFKPWPACRHAHPAIDAGLQVRDLLQGRPVASVLVETYADAVTFCDKPAPQSEGEAKFSLQHALAVVLARGRPVLADFAGAALDAPDLATLRNRVSVAIDARLTAAYPAHFGARVTATTADGRTLTAEVTDAWGDPENPIGDAAIIVKFHTLAAFAQVPAVLADELAEAVSGLAQDRPPSHLRHLLSRLTT